MPTMYDVIGHSQDGDRWLVLREGEEQARVVTLSSQTLSPLLTDEMIIDLSPWEPATEGPEELAAAVAEDDEEDAGDEQATALEQTDEEAAPETFKILIIDESKVTNDRRYFDEGALTWREPPFPVMFTETNTGEGHKGSTLGGVVRSAWRGYEDGTEDDKSPQLWGRGEYAPGDSGDRLKTLVTGEFMTGTSADIADADVEIELAEDDETPRQHIHSGVVIGTTVLPFPAYGDTRISAEEAVAAAAGEFVLNLVASAAEECESCQPPPEWFEDPRLPLPTPMTITDDGRIFGHLATRGVCHLGVQGQCLTVPMSRSDYAYFRTGATKVKDGRFVATGPITLGTGHASTQMKLSPQATLAHYDNTGTAVADVVCGEDAHGVWMAGAIRSGLEANRLHELRAAAPSGDWRNVGGSLELVAILAVNTPGFPVPRMKAELIGTKQVALVAAGVLVPDEETDPIDDRIARLEDAFTRLSLSQESLTAPSPWDSPDEVTVRIDYLEDLTAELAALLFTEEMPLIGFEQERDDHGRFAGGGGGGSTSKEPTGYAKVGTPTEQAMKLFPKGTDVKIAARSALPAATGKVVSVQKADTPNGAAGVRVKWDSGPDAGKTTSANAGNVETNDGRGISTGREAANSGMQDGSADKPLAGRPEDIESSGLDLTTPAAELKDTYGIEDAGGGNSKMQLDFADAETKADAQASVSEAGFDNVKVTGFSPTGGPGGYPLVDLKGPHDDILLLADAYENGRF